MTHRNDMSAWDEIACRRADQHDHRVETITVDLSRPHLYGDHPQLPEWLVPPPFEMTIWADRPYDSKGVYCPANDVISETIRTHHIWEPPETIVMLDIFTRTNSPIFLDVGAQLGWYSHLARSVGLRSELFEADADVVDVLADQGGVDDDWRVVHHRVDGRERFLPRHGDESYVAKVDIEGAEPAAVDELWPLIAVGRMDYMLIELSPVFHDGYPALVRKVMGAGFDMGIIPDKSLPPPKLESIDDLTWVTDPDEAADWIAPRHQDNVLFAHRSIR